MPSREKLKIERNFESVTKSKSNDMKEGDLILVSAGATGLGKPMEAVIDKIETFMGQTLERSLTRNQTTYPASVVVL